MIIKNEIPQVYLGEYDINVKTYLTYPQIQKIVDNTQALQNVNTEDGGKYDYWAARQQTIDMSLLLVATDISEEDLKNNTHDKFLFSGIIDKVKECIVNYNQLIEALEYTESLQKGFLRTVDIIEKVLEKNNYNITKFANSLKEIQNG